MGHVDQFESARKVRRVKDMKPNNQSKLFTAYRHHAVFTGDLHAARCHRPLPRRGGSRGADPRQVPS